MTDKYDEAIAYLTEHPEEIQDAWGLVDGSFRDVADGGTGGPLFLVTGSGCGCLTQIKAGLARAPSYALRDAILADHRIPENEEDITVDDLPVFAEWQRKIDAFHRGEQ